MAACAVCDTSIIGGGYLVPGGLGRCPECGAEWEVGELRATWKRDDLKKNRYYHVMAVDFEQGCDHCGTNTDEIHMECEHSKPDEVRDSIIAKLFRRRNAGTKTVVAGK